MNVVLSPAAQEQLEKLPTKIIPRIWRLVERLEDWPDVSGLKRLTGNLDGLFRLRTGDYRMVFRVDDTAITVESIGHRKDIYE